MKYLKPSWPAPNNVKAFTTTKLGWGNNPYDREEITNSENNDIKELLALPAEPIWINQTHSNVVIEAVSTNKNLVADASFTTHPHNICVVLTADCLPLFITNKQGTKVAAIHAGWRGLAAGIIEQTLQELNFPADETLVWLGPAIGPQKFEVGSDVYDAFVSHHEDAANAFVPQQESKWLANLYALARLRLHQKGVKKIYGGDYCTYTQDDLFFSYRRDGKETGRMASLIWIDAKA